MGRLADAIAEADFDEISDLADHICSALGGAQLLQDGGHFDSSELANALESYAPSASAVELEAHQ